MHVVIRIFKCPDFEVNVPKMATIKDLQISILDYLRIPITENNLKAIFIIIADKRCTPSHKLSSLNITERSVICCRICTNLLEKDIQTDFEEEIDEFDDNIKNSNNYSDNNTNFHNAKTDLGSDYFNDSSGINNNGSPPDRLYQSSKYIFDDEYIDAEDPPSDPSELCFLHARRNRAENMANHNKLPIFNDLILAKEDNDPKGHIKQLKRFEGAQNYSNRISRAKSSINFKQNLNSSSFTSGQNLSLKQNEPSCDTLPCCFPTYFPSSYSTNGISLMSNFENGNNDNSDKNSAARNTNGNINDDNNNNDNSNNNSNNNNNNFLGLDFSIRTEDQKSNF